MRRRSSLPGGMLLVLMIFALGACWPLEAQAHTWCPHHNFRRHGGTVLYEYMGHRTGDVWHKHYYNRYVWNGARYVFDYGAIRKCYRVDIAHAGVGATAREGARL